MYEQTQQLDKSIAPLQMTVDVKKVSSLEKGLGKETNSPDARHDPRREGAQEVDDGAAAAAQGVKGNMCVWLVGVVQYSAQDSAIFNRAALSKQLVSGPQLRK